MINLSKDTPLKDVMKLAHPCGCNACTIGCKLGSGILADEDLAKIAHFLGKTKEETKKEFLEEVERFNTKRFRPKVLGKPYGQCIFFDGKECKIHEVKPLECEISMGCEEYGEQLSIWFMLNHFVNKNDPESIRQYDAYLRSGGKTLPGGTLADLVPNAEQLKKILKFEILR
ncbi:MAG TPA: YkgJ family cysteine cluster protein [Candidatus Nanoarchaeia archaeon]|nr:YkgJ family cysteine cluster protein [Candidatus Nanoarchaeia archaeon]